MIIFCFHLNSFLLATHPLQKFQKDERVQFLFVQDVCFSPDPRTEDSPENSARIVVCLCLHMQWPLWAITDDHRATTAAETRCIANNFLSAAAILLWPILWIRGEQNHDSNDTEKWGFCHLTSCVDIYLWFFLSLSKETVKVQSFPFITDLCVSGFRWWCIDPSCLLDFYTEEQEQPIGLCLSSARHWCGLLSRRERWGGGGGKPRCKHFPCDKRKSLAAFVKVSRTRLSRRVRDHHSEQRY